MAISRFTSIGKMKYWSFLVTKFLPPHLICTEK